MLNIIELFKTTLALKLHSVDTITIILKNL